MRSKVAAATLALLTTVPTFASLAHAGDRSATRPVPAPAPTKSSAPVRLPAPARIRPPIPVAVQTSERVIALTFDDGPDPRWTPAVLEALAATGARATFFVTGEHARAHADLLQATAAAGHEVANHTDTHPLIDELPMAAVRDEAQRTTEAIVAAGVAPTPFFRPPKGRYREESLAAVDDLGLETIGWTVCLERWLRRGRLLGVEETVARVRPGGIVVAHDGGIPDRTATITALPRLLERLRAEGYRVVTVSELLRLGPTVVGVPGSAGPPPILAGGVQPGHDTTR